jgi:hypothetical protein
MVELAPLNDADTEHIAQSWQETQTFSQNVLIFKPWIVWISEKKEITYQAQTIYIDRTIQYQLKW